MPFVIACDVTLHTARALWNSLLKMMSFNLIIMLQYTRIPCVILKLKTVHVCCGFENHSFCSYRLRLVTGFTNRTKETGKLRIQENETGNETFSTTYVCNRATKCCCCCHLHRKYTTRLERRHPAALRRNQAKKKMAEMCNEIWDMFGNLMKKNHNFLTPTSWFSLVLWICNTEIFLKNL